MSQPKSEFLREAQARGYIHQATDTDGLDTVLCEKAPVPAYIGFDCTADSLHVGSLVPIMLLRLLQQTGHKPVVLMGGGTTKIGDPSGKDGQRQLLGDDEIQANMAGIKAIFRQFLTFGDGPTDAVMVNNDDWLRDLNYISFLRDYGQHFSVNRMLTFDSVRLRLDREQPLTFLEFNYMILQAYDFLELSRRMDCRLQMGGSDQWGNIVNGVELTRRVDGRELFGLTTPLMTTASGQKMGKTHQGAIWLNEKNLSSYDYYQFWRNTEDADVGRFLRLFTGLPIEEIERLEALPGAEINEAKKVLAFEATKLCRGEDAAATAAETARRVFEEHTLGEDLPRIAVSRDRLAGGVPLYELLRETGLANTNGEARRLIKGGGARVNDAKIADESAQVSAADIGENGVIKLSAGKKRHALVEVG
ncbi:tyrosine--tRNA ligase [Ferruginivarius sediminum]|uniref:Tyrosine--tRNA ligase n=1 Tax=Ferruginivarius sediminum TaxID=2661937 RepID=A0A369T7P3_9PROT|nr:tyrosine--tRNA ligase [Ferruginivarius sediminum]RDD61343.1 tyrosine--tRNA ligase [Ferruginivarius sediminum]